MVYKFFDKKNFWWTIKNENISNKELAEELNKPIIWKFNKRKVHSRFVGNIWGADLADMQLISKLNSRFRFLLFVIFIPNMHGSFFFKIKEEFQVLMLFKKF